MDKCEINGIICECAKKYLHVTSEPTLLRCDRLDSGRSGAMVYRIKIESAAQGKSGWYIIKCIDTNGEYYDSSDNEATKHHLALFDSGNYENRLIRSAIDAQIDGYHVIIYEQANHRIDSSQPLRKIEDNIKFKDYLDCVSFELLHLWNNAASGTRSVDSYFSNVLSYRMQQDGAFCRKNAMCGIDNNSPSINIDRSYYPNPIYYLYNHPDIIMDLVKKNVPTFYLGNTHGDLHGENIIVDLDSRSTEYKIIDFDSYRNNCFLLFDHAYLELYFYLLDGEELDSKNWIDVVAPCIEPNALSELNDCISKYAIVRNAICGGIEKWINMCHLGEKEDIELQFRLSRIAAGINFFSKGAIKDELTLKKLLHYIGYNLKQLFIYKEYDWDMSPVTSAFTPTKYGENIYSNLYNTTDGFLNEDTEGADATGLSKEEEFAEYVCERLDNESFAGDYLNAGLSSDLNLGNRLTPNIFIKHFLVERNKDDYKEVAAKISRLFQSDIRNLFCIEAGRGSGKSTFVNTTLLSTDKDHYFVYPYPYFDFTKRCSGNEYCECEVLAEFEKVYEELKNDKTWQETFYTAIKKVKITVSDIGGYFSSNLRRSINLLEKNEFSMLYEGHASRIKDADTVDIKVFLLLYLVALATRPDDSSKRDTRWIMLFDGIEAYVTKDAEEAIKIIAEVHEFLRNAFDSAKAILGTRFFTKFTFVFPVRTATSLNIKHAVDGKGQKIWGNNKENIVKLPQLDFSIEALLKKIKYLVSLTSGVDDALQRPLIQRCFEIVSVLIHSKQIIKYLRGEVGLNEAASTILAFADRKLLPLFNYDHRNLVDRLCELATEEDSSINFQAMRKIDDSLKDEYAFDLSYAANGKHMIFFRSIFNRFRKSGLLNQIGYTDFDNLHQPGVARTLLNFLYYKEMSYRLKKLSIGHYDAGGEFYGVSFIELLEMLKPFANSNITELAHVIYNISTLNAATTFAYSWSHLIEIREVNQRMPEDKFAKLVENYYQNNEKATFSDWRVVLSDAGLSYTSWASKQFEFLLSRCKDSGSVALFAIDYENEEAFKESCNLVRRVIKEEGISKLIESVKKDCKYRKKSETDCESCDTINDPYTAFDCSLLQRYQECLMLIVESIDYIDRYRCYAYQYGISNGFSDETIRNHNEMILEEIKLFNDLFDDLEDKVLSEFDESMNFLAKMNKATRKYKHYSYYDYEYADASIYGKKYMKRVRAPRTHRWYIYPPAHMHLLIDIAVDNPSDIRLFDMNKDISIKHNRIMCKICKKVVESFSNTDSRKCSCESCSVEGGNEKLIRDGRVSDWEEMSEVSYNNNNYRFVNDKWCIVACDKNGKPKEVNMVSSNPTVFVTYAWDEKDPGNDYIKEVDSFVDELRHNGYDATYDRRMFAENHNWTEIMNKGLQMDKIIVLLSKNYKTKAEAETRRGVTIEQNALVTRFKKDKQSIVFAKLPSQHNYSFEEILPVVFSGEHIIDLSSTNKADGYNLLFRTLACKSITGVPAPVNPIINEGNEL